MSGEVGAVIREWMPRVGAVDRSPLDCPHRPLKGDSAVRDIQNLPDDGHLYAAHVINDIWRITEGSAVVVTDVGQHQMWEAQYYHHETPRSLITSGGLGTMGFALPAAIGAKIGRPDAEVWVIVGDGGFQMTMAELATMVQEELDVKVAVINNGYPRNGAPVAGVLLSAALRGDADFRTRLRDASPSRSESGPRPSPSVRKWRAQSPRHGVSAARSSTSASSRRTRSTRWCRQEPTFTR